MGRISLLVALLVFLLLSAAASARRSKNKPKHVFETAAAFTPAECSEIVSAAKAQPQEEAVLHDGKGGSQRDVNARDSTLTWLDVAPGSKHRWVLERMQSQLRRGESAWGVRSLGLGTHGIQVATYKDGHHYEWHTDSSAPVGGVSHGRILSVTVQLSQPEAYVGGEVEMGTYGNISTDIGTLALFPSYLPHKVHRVTSGVRHSIVAWFAGEWDAAYWKLAQSSYATMLLKRPEICEAHEWFAETLASEDAYDAAISSLVDAIDCNDGTRVLQQRVIENAAGAPRLPEALLAAEQRFRSVISNSDGDVSIAQENLQKVAKAIGKTEEAQVPSSEVESDVVAGTRQSATGGAREIEAAQLQERLLDDLLDEMDAEEERQVQIAAAMASRSAAAGTEHDESGTGAAGMDNLQDDLLDSLLDEL